MRYLIVCLLFSFSLSAQSDNEISPRFVWAESGLTMRAEGKSGAEKVMVIPFGGKVMPTGEVGQTIQVTALKSVTYTGHGGTIKSDPYIMHDSYVEVTYEGKKGFVYNGFLSRFSPLVSSSESPGFTRWLDVHCGVPKEVPGDRIMDNEYERTTVTQYPNGAMYTTTSYEGGGSTTIVFPVGTLNEGYLFVAHFFGVTNAVDERGKVAEEDDDFLPELLDASEDSVLRFVGDMSETVIRVIGGMLIIHSSGGC